MWLLLEKFYNNERPSDEELKELIKSEWKNYKLTDNIGSFLKQIPKVFLKFTDDNIMEEILLENPLDIQYLENPTDKQKRICLQKDGNVLEYISKPNYNDYLNAIKSTNSEEIYDLIPSELLTDELIYEGLSNNFKLFKKIPEDILKADKVNLSINKGLLMEKNHYFYRNIPKKYITNEIIYNFLVITHGKGLSYLDESEKTRDIIIKSIELSKGVSLQYVNNPDLDIRKKALSYHWEIYQLIKDPTKEEEEMYLELKDKLKEPLCLSNLQQRYLFNLTFSKNFNCEKI